MRLEIIMYSSVAYVFSLLGSVINITDPGKGVADESI